MLKKQLCLFICLLHCVLVAQEFPELPDEFFIINESSCSGIAEWFHLDSPKKHLGKVYQDYNRYTLFDAQNKPVAETSYTFSFLHPSFDIHDMEGNLLGSLKSLPVVVQPRAIICTVVNANNEKLFLIETHEYYDYLRPFVFLDLDQKAIGMFSKPFQNYTNFQMLNRFKFSSVDPRVLSLVVVLLADFRHWIF